jgi:transposase, IS30 family
MGRWRKIGPAEEREIWDRIEAGENLSSVGRTLGRHSSAIHMLLKRTGGARPRSAPPRSTRFLTLEEREEISRGVSANESLRCIARRLGRAPSTISREVERNEGRTNYRATDADRATRQRERRPKAAKLVLCPRLARVVEARLAVRWSPQQIAAWLPVEYPNDPEMRVSHETIYMSLFVQGRGALRKELTTCLRSGRAIRRPRAARQKPLAGIIQDMVMISERPAEVADRAVPGHWEGDLLMGKKKLSIATLVERKSRYVMLVRVPGDTKAETVRKAVAKQILKLPTELRRSLTWDQGKEMNEHLRFTIDTGVQVYFCEPSSPWQRGSNENTNGLLRQYFPKGSDLSVHSQAHLNAVARELNGRPRQTLGWMTPSQVFSQAVAATG